MTARPGLLPFELFIDQLKRQGFDIGVGQYLDLERLLARLGDEFGPAELKMLLCPLFAKSGAQQEQFYSAFDDFYPLLRIEEGTGPGPDPPFRKRTEPPPVAVRTRRWPWVLAGMGIFVVSVALLSLWSRRFVARPAAPAKAAVTQRQNTRPPATPTPSNSVSPPRETPRRTLQAQVTRIPPAVSRLPAWYSSRRIALGWTAVVGPLVVFFVSELYRLRRRRLVIRQARGKVPPYKWPIRAATAASVYESGDIARVGRVLQRRYLAGSARLNVAATVEASVAALGWPVLRYRVDSRLPEYLFLIDRVNLRDHQAAMYGSLSADLRAQGLYVDCWFYEDDPRICRNAAGDESIRLDQLRRTHADYRRAIFGRCGSLLDAVTGDPVSWIGIFNAWPARAILTPKPEERCGDAARCCWHVHSRCSPATIDGLMAAGEYFASDPGAVFSAPNKGRLPSAEGGEDSMAALREELGEAVFQWLCACAVYPELQWELTLALGALPSLPRGLVCEANLLQLVRRDWFRAGNMPKEARRELMLQIDPAVERDAGGVIIGLLEGNPPPAETHASYSYGFEIAWQRYRRQPDDRSAQRELERTMKDLPPDEIPVDYATLDFAGSLRGSRLDVNVPRRLAALLYPRGSRWFGLRIAARVVVAVLTAVALLQALRLLDRDSNAKLARYRSALSRGVNLAAVEEGGSLHITWWGDAPAVRVAETASMTIREGAKDVEVVLSPEQLKSGSVVFGSAVEGDLAIRLSIQDAVANRIVEGVALRVPVRAKEVATGPVPNSPTNPLASATVKIGGKSFQYPVAKSPPIAPAAVPDAPGILPADTAASNSLSRALEFVNVLPSPPAAPSTRRKGWWPSRVRPREGAIPTVCLSGSHDIEMRRFRLWNMRTKMRRLWLGPTHRNAAGGLGPKDLMVLVNQQATRAAFDDAIRNFVRAHAYPYNTLVIFFSGRSERQVVSLDTVTGKTNTAEATLSYIRRQPAGP